MELREELLFGNSRGAKLEIELGTSDGEEEQITLGLKAVLTKTVADALNVGWVFASDTTSHGGFKDMNLEKSTQFADLQLKMVAETSELETLFPTNVYSFKVSRLPGGSPAIECKVDIDGNTDAVLEFLRQNRSDGFSFMLKPRQQELFEGGTRVDLAAASEEPAEPVGDEVPDRSHENAPRRRGRPAGSRNRVQPIAQTDEEKAEWDKHYEEKAAEHEPEAVSVE